MGEFLETRILKALKHELNEIADPDKAHVLSRFFKTGRGQYGEGDRFIGITVPKQRKIAEKYQELPFIPAPEVGALSGRSVELWQ